MKTFFGEIKLFLSCPWRVVLFLFLPPLITIYFGLVFQDGVVEHTRTVIVDQDQSSLSRSLVQNFKENKGFRIVHYETQVEAGLDLIRQEKADVLLALPEGFSQDIKSGKRPSIYLGVNGANMAISSNAAKRASAIILTFNGGIEITKLQARGYTPSEGMSIAQPIQIEYRQTGNPSGNFYDFLVWGLIGAIGHFPILLFSATAFAPKEKKIKLSLFLNRFVVYVLFGMTELLLSVFILVTFFPVVFKGGLLSLVLLVASFVMAVTALGMLLSLAIKDRTLVCQAATLVALPALILSGHTWPVSGLPWLIQVLGRLEPLTYFADPLRHLALTGQAGPGYLKNCQVLLLMALLFLGASLIVLGLRKKTCSSRKKEFKYKSKALFNNKILLGYTLILVILIIFIGLVYQKGALDQMELLLVDLDQTSTSRLITGYLTDNEKFQVSFSRNYQEVSEAMQGSEAIAAIVIPKGLEASVKGKTGGEILFLVDGTNYILANSIYAKAHEILLSVNGGIALKTLAGAGFLPDEADKMVQPTELTQNILFNPHYNYSYYLTYGICGAGIFSLVMSAIALSLYKNREENVSSWKELGVKILIYGLFLSVIVVLLFVLAQVIFDLPAQGSILSFLPLAFGYSLLIIIFGVILSAITNREEGIFQLGVFFATTLFFTTGYSWPLQSLPEIMKPVYYLNPLTPFINGVRACFVMGVESRVLGRYVLWQLALCLFYALPGLVLYQWRSGKREIPDSTDSF